MTDEDTTLRMERFFTVPPERVFRAFTTAEELRRIWTSDSHPITELTVDARPGGGWGGGFDKLEALVRNGSGG